MRFLAIFIMMGAFALPAAAQPGPRNGPRVDLSIDVWVLNARTVAIGKVTRGPDRNARKAEVFVRQDAVLKGEIPADGQIREIQGAPKRGERGLVLDRVFLSLDDKDLAVPTATGILLRTPDKVLDYVKNLLRTHPGGGPIQTFSRPIPQEWIDRTGKDPGIVWRRLNNALAVPVDSVLERWAIETIQGGNPGEMPRAFQALRLFRSPANIDLLKGLLGDMRFNGKPAETNNGIEIRDYTVRELAYRGLKDWGIEVDAPVLHEEISRLESIETIRWQGIPDDADLQKLAAVGKLKSLEITTGVVSQDQLATIGRITSLTRLTIHGQMTNPRLQHLRNLTNLRELDLAASSRLTDEGLSEIARLPHLTRLVLASTPISDEGLAMLTRLPTLEFVDLTLTQTTKKGVEAARRTRPDLVIERAGMTWLRAYPFAAAAFQGDIGAVRKYIEMQAFGLDKGRTPAIFYAVGQNRRAIVQLLLDNKTPVTLRDPAGHTLLHWATKHGYKSMANFLMQRGATP